MRRSVLITGGAGFLGVHLARKLLKHKYDVTIFDIADLDAADLHKKVRFIKGDVLNKKAVSAAIKRHTHVVHAAAALPIQRKKKAIFSVNIDGTRNVLDAVVEHKIHRLVFISTTAVYGIPKVLPEREDTPLHPIGHYGTSKAMAEGLCLEYAERSDVSVNILRPKSFLGPERLGVFEIWFEAIFKNKRIFLLGDGNNTFQLLAVSDVTDAIQKALETNITGEIFNIGAEEYGTWREDLGYVIQKVESKATITSLPVFPSQVLLQLLDFLNLSPLSAWHYKTMPRDSYVAIQKAEKLLQWHPKQSNKELLLASYLWYKQHRYEVFHKKGKTHRVGWNFKLLNILSRV